MLVKRLTAIWLLDATFQASYWSIAASWLRNIDWRLDSDRIKRQASFMVNQNNLS